MHGLTFFFPIAEGQSLKWFLDGIWDHWKCTRFLLIGTNAHTFTLDASASAAALEMPMTAAAAAIDDDDSLRMVGTHFDDSVSLDSIGSGSVSGANWNCHCLAHTHTSWEWFRSCDDDAGGGGALLASTVVHHSSRLLCECESVLLWCPRQRRSVCSCEQKRESEWVSEHSEIVWSQWRRWELRLRLKLRERKRIAVDSCGVNGGEQVPACLTALCCVVADCCRSTVCARVCQCSVQRKCSTAVLSLITIVSSKCTRDSKFNALQNWMDEEMHGGDPQKRSQPKLRSLQKRMRMRMRMGFKLNCRTSSFLPSLVHHQRQWHWPRRAGKKIWRILVANRRRRRQSWSSIN